MANTISIDKMRRIIEMVENRGYQNIVFYTVPLISPEIPSSSSKKKAKPVERQIYYEQNHTIMGTEYLDNEEDYAAEVESAFLNSMVLIGEDMGDEGVDRLILLFPSNDTSLNVVRDATSHTLHLNNENVPVSLTLILGEEQLSAPAMKELSKPSPFKFQHFTWDEVRFPSCIFLPTYEPLTSEESNILFDELQVPNGNDFPKALTGDPVIKYYGFEQGTILRINRENIGLPTVIEDMVGYAIVVMGNPLYKRKDKKEE